METGITQSLEEQSSSQQIQQKVEDMFKKVNLPVTIKFEDVVHKIKPNSTGNRCYYNFLKKKTKSKEKTILNGVSGVVSPGELLAILGPSGSGKTTLLTALAGRIDTGDTAGTITYNNKPFSATVKRTTGFVSQTNVFYPHLTVSETLIFTSLLRLPNSLMKREKIMHAEAVISQLRLSKCKNTVIGGRFVKGLSGGERKRISIGQELLINPSLLFLDEPTSGLDSTMAKKVLMSLVKLAEGRTVLMTIHQPASCLFYMFTKILLLTEGNSIYFGKGEDVMNYFGSIGFCPSVAMNPSDFLVDLANGVASGDQKEDSEAVKQTLISAYKSNLSNKLKAEFQDMETNHSLTTSVSAKCNQTASKWNTTWWQYFSVLIRRDLKERRHDAFSGLKIGQILFLSIVTGLIWWQSNTDNLQDQVGLLFFYSRQAGFFPLFSALHTFPLQRLMLEKERSSGMYRLSSYLVAKTASDFLLELVLPTIFILITYFMVGLKPTLTNFFSTLLATVYTTLVAQSLGLAIGAIVQNQRQAGVIATTLMLTFLLTGGFFVQNVPRFISWLEYLSFTNYSYKLLLLSQYKPNETYNCGSDSRKNVVETCLVGDYSRIKFVGLNHRVLSVFVMGLMLLGFRVVTYFALRRVGVSGK